MSTCLMLPFQWFSRSSRAQSSWDPLPFLFAAEERTQRLPWWLGMKMEYKWLTLQLPVTVESKTYRRYGPELMM
jgi:hypothetical protein